MEFKGAFVPNSHPKRSPLNFFKGVPHTYRAESHEGGHFITVTVHGDFERFVRALAHPAPNPGLPGPASPEAIQALAETAARYGIEFVGPPLT